MSFDLIFWCQKLVPTPEEAAQVYDQLTDGIAGVEESPAVEEFHQAVTLTYPDLDDDNMHESPWASPLHVTNECVIAAISGSRAGEVSPVLLDLAATRGMVAYDPQNQVVYGVSGQASSR